jgi:hypothetical protein
MALYALYLPHISPHLPISPLYLPYFERLMALYAVRVMVRVRVGVRVRLKALCAVLVP